jgi:hypothetical protein
VTAVLPRTATLRGVVCALTCALVTSCTYAGTGFGVLTKAAATAQGIGQPAGNVSFAWKTDGSGTEGELTATLADGRVYTGTFLQMTDSARNEVSSLYWTYWRNPRWGAQSWGPGYYGPRAEFATFYRGKVLAYLQAPDKSLMRCRFILRRPSEGVRGGGQGECQMSTQENVFGATLQPAA